MKLPTVTKLIHHSATITSNLLLQRFYKTVSLPNAKNGSSFLCLPPFFPFFTSSEWSLVWYKICCYQFNNDRCRPFSLPAPTTIITEKCNKRWRLFALLISLCNWWFCVLCVGNSSVLIWSSAPKRKKNPPSIEDTNESVTFIFPSSISFN